jgi:hypothetical protein
MLSRQKNYYISQCLSKSIISGTLFFIVINLGSITLYGYRYVLNAGYKQLKSIECGRL